MQFEKSYSFLKLFYLFILSVKDGCNPSKDEISTGCNFFGGFYEKVYNWKSYFCNDYCKIFCL